MESHVYCGADQLSGCYPGHASVHTNDLPGYQEQDVDLEEWHVESMFEIRLGDPGLGFVDPPDG